MGIESISNQPPKLQDPNSTMKAVLFLLIVVGISVIQSDPSIQFRLPSKLNPFQKVGNFKHQVGQLFHGKVNRVRSKLTGLKQHKMGLLTGLKQRKMSKKNLFQNKAHTIEQSIRSGFHNLKNKF